MAWVRLDDNIAQHPKITSVDPVAAYLWIVSIAFASRFLSNGFIPASSVASLSHIRYVRKYARQLVKARLWDEVEGGYQIHDYHDFNLTADEVKEKRKQDAARKMSERTPKRVPVESIGSPRVRARDPIPSHPIPVLNTKNKQGSSAGASTTSEPTASAGGPPTTTQPEPDARSKRPIFRGTRLVVFEWQLDNLTRMLGDHTDAFHLDEWFHTLNQHAEQSGLVIPQRDNGVWLLQQTLAEATRRGLPIATTADDAAPHVNKQSRQIMAIMANMKGDR